MRTSLKEQLADLKAYAEKWVDNYEQVLALLEESRKGLAEANQTIENRDAEIARLSALVDSKDSAIICANNCTANSRAQTRDMEKFHEGYTQAAERVFSILAENLAEKI